MKANVKGPLIISGQNPGTTTQPPPDYNFQLNPSLSWGGVGFIDPRWGYQDSGAYNGIGHSGGDFMTVDAIPTASAANNIVLAGAGSTGTNVTLTLVAATGSGVTVMGSAVQVYSANTIIPSGTLAIEGLPGLILNSNNSSCIAVYSPSSSLARAVKVTSSGNDAAGSVTVSGWDLYGFPQTEKITGASGTAALGKKAWKFISGVKTTGLSGSNIAVGTQDVFGFPIKATKFAYANIYWNSALITAITGFTSADVTTPATSTTGDPRGSYAVQSAADGTKQLTIIQMVTPAMVQAGAVGFYGVPPA